MCLRPGWIILWVVFSAATVAGQTVDEQLLPTGRQLDPAGESLAWHGRPVDLVVVEGWLLVKDRGALQVIDIASWELRQSLESPGGASLTGLEATADGDLYFSNAKQEVHHFAPTGDSAEPYRLETTISLPADSYPCGIAISADSSTAWVCLSRKNSLAEIDLKTGSLRREIPVGIAPFEIVRLNDSRLLVTNLGGNPPEPGAPSAPSAGTETAVDERGVAKPGTVSLVDTGLGKVVHTWPAGRHPSRLCLDSGPNAAIVNTNDDSITLLDPDAGPQATRSVKPDAQLPFGSMPSDIARLPDGGPLLISLAGNNAIGVFDGQTTALQALIPTGWYPVALAHDDQYLFVANVKGNGARAPRRDPAEGRNSHDHQGTVQRIPRTRLLDSDWLEAETEKTRVLARLPQILRNLELKESMSDREPVPVPETLGEPSVFEHVIYVIKENRTFDQVFGDFAQARSEPELCVFPRHITPNHHALAERFGILDNYYCNGVLSADGHSWATEGNVTPYLERAFGGFSRSYTFGDDPLTYSSTGFLWDRFLDAGLSFRNYGEFDYAQPPEGMQYQELWNAHENGDRIAFEQQIGIRRLREYSYRDYPGWNMQIPDVLRIERFLEEFRQFEETGGLPNLCIVYLPQDHLGGGVTSEAHMADNDLALGKLVEAVSHSRFWKNTVIVVNEDDPQNGFDHIDGHRSLCLVISPWSRPGVNHSFYNQTAVLRTILHLFGLPPLNQQDASTNLMGDCFQETPNFEPYRALANNVPLNQQPAPPAQQSATERRWRAVLATVPIERTGMKTPADEDHLNRFIWHEVKGWETPYPSEWAGPHGRGLSPLGLQHDSQHPDDDTDRP